MDRIITDVFALCVLTLQFIGEWTGLGYELANLIIFILIQPALTLSFLWLWRKEKAKAAFIRQWYMRV